jgi:pyruvate dehydrogenase E1 component alpha subunit
MHLVDKAVGFMGTSAIVGNSIPIGVGLALGLKLENTKDIAVVFLGDGATEEGVFYESLNFAAVRNLPVLFVCENNAYSVYSPLSCRQPKERKIFKVAESLGVNSFEMDGNDVIPMLEKIGQAVHSVRKMGCPVLIECHTYRWREHCGPNFDDDLNYRDKLEVQNWRAKDPIKKLISELDLTEVEVKKIREQIDIEVKNAFDYAKASPFPDASEAYKDEFAQR